MEKERYKVRVSDDLCFVGVFDLQENKYVVNESVICLDTAHLLCDLFNKVDKQVSRIKELEKENQKANIKNYLTDYYLVEKENLQLKERLSIKMEELHIAYCGIEDIKTRNGNLKAEIKQLKQSQKQLAISELKKLKDYFCEEYVDDEGYKTNDREITKDGCEIANEIDNQIKKLEKDFEKK